MTYGPKPIPAIDRILRRTKENPETGCWEWQGPLDSVGYGSIGIGGHNTRHVRNHRVTYEFFIAEIPDGLVIDHLCRNRPCCNPWHLEPVTHKVNLHRGETITAANAAVTHCPQGHAYDAANTHRNRDGSRRCRACQYLQTKASRARRAAELTPDSPLHGRANTYKCLGCRCDKCREWQRADRQERRAA